LFWAEFVKAAAADRIDQIDHAAVARYEAIVLGSALAPKSQHHRFAKIKSVIAYAMKRGIDTQACRHALDALAMLEVKNAHALDHGRLAHLSSANFTERPSRPEISHSRP
jgi:hypothetical protein